MSRQPRRSRVLVASVATAFALNSAAVTPAAHAAPGPQGTPDVTLGISAILAMELGSLLLPSSIGSSEYPSDPCGPTPGCGVEEGSAVASSLGSSLGSSLLSSEVLGSSEHPYDPCGPTPECGSGEALSAVAVAGSALAGSALLSSQSSVADGSSEPEAPATETPAGPATGPQAGPDAKAEAQQKAAPAKTAPAKAAPAKTAPAQAASAPALANTGASVLGVVGVALASLVAGLGVLLYRRRAA